MLHCTFPLCGNLPDTPLLAALLLHRVAVPSSVAFCRCAPPPAFARRCPWQSIYGFRGAASSLMQRTFLEVFPDSAVTYLLSDNYRSRPTIVRVADTIRRHA